MSAFIRVTFDLIITGTWYRTQFEGIIQLTNVN